MGWRNCKMEAIILWSGILSPPCCSVPPPTQVDTVGGSCASNANITCSLLNVLSSNDKVSCLLFIIVNKDLFGQVFMIHIQLVFIDSYPNIFHISESALRVLSIFISVTIEPARKALHSITKGSTGTIFPSGGKTIIALCLCAAWYRPTSHCMSQPHSLASEAFQGCVPMLWLPGMPSPPLEPRTSPPYP